jgi:hypothetical protein
MPVSMDLRGVPCSGSLHRWTPLGTSCLEIVGSDGIRLGAPMFLSDRLVLEGVLRSSAGCYHHATWFPVPWWSQLAENVMEAKLWGLAMVVRVFVAMRKLLCDSWLIPAAWKVGTKVHEKLKVLPCRMKIQCLALIGCVWQWPCWRHCFVSAGFSPRWKPKIYDQTTMMLVHYFLLGGGFLVLSWWC